MLLVSCAPCCFVLHAAAVMSASSCPLGSNPGLMGSLCSTLARLSERSAYLGCSSGVYLGVCCVASPTAALLACRYFPAQQVPHPELGCEVLDSQHFRLAPQPGG